jgi:hypothetical protein
MARAQDASVQTGGQIDPYVAQSMSQRKQATENRLLESMRQAGATQRQAMAGAQQARMQQASLQAQTEQQAAQLAADDRRAAERIAENRKERAIREAELKATNKFRRDKLALDQQRLDDLRADREYTKGLEEKKQALKKILIAHQIYAADRDLSTIRKIAGVTKNNKTAEENLKTTYDKKGKDYDQKIRMFNLAKSQAAKSISETDYMKISLDWGQKKEKFLVPARHVRAGISSYLAGASEIPGWSYTKLKGRPEASAQPLQALQEAASRNSSNLTLEMIGIESDASKLEDAIANGEVDASDVTGFMAAHQALKEEISNLIETGEKTAKSRKIWQTADAELDIIEDKIETLIGSEKKIRGSDTETVGMRIRSGLAPTNPEYAPDLQAQLKRDLDRLGGLDEVLEFQGQPREVMLLFDDMGDDDSPESEARREWNEIMSMAERFGEGRLE